jgi:hypothetical protein
MKLLVCIAQSLVSYMGVDLGGGDIGMTEEHLDRAEVSAI